MINKSCVGEFNGCRFYTGLRLDDRLRLWAQATSALRTVSAVAELVVVKMMTTALAQTNCDHAQVVLNSSTCCVSGLS